MNSGPQTIELFPWMNDLATGSFTAASAYIFYGIWDIGAGIDFTFSAEAGTYTLEFIGISSGYTGVVDVKVNGAVVADDKPLNAGSANAIYTVTGITLVNGENTLEILPVSGTNYVQLIRLRKTA